MVSEMICDQIGGRIAWRGRDTSYRPEGECLRRMGRRWHRHRITVGTIRQLQVEVRKYLTTEFVIMHNKSMHHHHIITTTTTITIIIILPEGMILKGKRGTEVRVKPRHSHFMVRWVIRLCCLSRFILRLTTIVILVIYSPSFAHNARADISG